MTAQEAQGVLLRYRPGGVDADDPQVAEALELVQRDAELRDWYHQHCAFQQAMREKFRQIPVPGHLKESLLAQRKIVPWEAGWRKPLWRAAAAAAALVLLAGLASVWLRPDAPDRFADYRARMVSTALRKYRMDLVTNDMTQLRRFMAARGAPSDYLLTRGLEQRSLTGGACLRWRGHAVSMVCFDRGDEEMLYLFVLPRSVLRDPPSPAKRLAKVNKLLTVSWSDGDKAYVLAGPEEPEFDQKYL